MPPRIVRPRRNPLALLTWEAGLAIGVGVVAGCYIFPPIFREVTGLDKLYQEQQGKEAGAGEGKE